jgi:membrane-associated phospholipid phosphatase
MTVTGVSPARAGTSYLVANVVAGLRAPLRPPRGPRVKLLVPAWRRYAVALVLAPTLVLAAMLSLDATVMRGVAQLPRSVIDAFDDITDLGLAGWFLVPLGVLLLLTPVLSAPRLTHMARGVLTMLAIRLGFLVAAIGLTGLAGTILKRMIGRFRPSEFGPLAFDPFSWHSAYASLPSGHTTTAFAALVAFGVLFPRLRAVFWVYALTIAVSRVIVSAHFPSDVLAGAAFGAFGAIFIRDWFALRRLGFYIGSDGRVGTMPGPSWRRLKRVARALLGQ